MGGEIKVDTKEGDGREFYYFVTIKQFMSMSKILSFAIFLFLWSYCYAQTNKTDSLKKEMDSYTKKDTVRIKKIMDYSYSLYETDINKAIMVAKEGLELANELNWYLEKVEILSDLANWEGLEEKYDMAISYALEALKMAEDAGDQENVALAHYRLSEFYRLFKDDSLKEFHAQKFLEIATSIQNKRLMERAMVLVAAIYGSHDEWDKADSLYNIALKMAVELNSENLKIEILEFKAERLAMLKDYKGAITINKQCLLYMQKIHSYHGIAWLYSVLSGLYTEINAKDSAYFYAQSALEISKKNSLTKELNDAYDALYYCHYKFGDYKKALEYKIIYDSIYNKTFDLASGQNAERARMQMDQERKDALAKTEEIRKDADAKRARNLQYTAIGIFLLIAIFLFWNNRQKQKSKIKIEKAYTELKATQAQLIQSEKMASLGELTAGIAHEIQNPLNFVNNFSDVNKELLLEMKDEMNKGNLDDANAIADDVISNEEKINHHGKRADAIVKGMLQHSRSSNGVKEPTNINALADEYLRLSYHGLRAKDKEFNAIMKTDFDNSIGKINIIPQDIGRVLLNLYNNAFYAVTEKKKQQPNDYEPTISVTTKKINNKVDITVKDNGNGIPQKVIDKIFQPFFTTKPTGQGTGLGLSLSYDIIKAHGGEIKVNTIEGEFTEFVIQLPISV